MARAAGVNSLFTPNFCIRSLFGRHATVTVAMMSAAFHTQSISRLVQMGGTSYDAPGPTRETVYSLRWGLNVCGLISDMMVRLRTSLVTKRALFTTNAMGYHYTNHKQCLEASVTLVQYHTTSTYIDTVHGVHMRAYAVSGPSQANGPHSTHAPNDTTTKTPT